MMRDKTGRFIKGIPPWNKGKTLGPNPEHSERMKGNKNNLGKKNALGSRRTPEQKKRLSACKKGNLNGFKKGEGNVRYTGYLHKRYKIRVIDWLALRQLILERDLFRCQNCGKTHHEVLLDIHHKIPFRISKDNCVENLITLCRSCHQKEEHKTLIELRAKAGGKTRLYKTI